MWLWWWFCSKTNWLSHPTSKMAAVTGNKLKQILNTYIFFEQSKHEVFKAKSRLTHVSYYFVNGILHLKSGELHS
jgi:hypothetical protein